MNRNIFLVGAPRSGTTLFAEILNKYPHVFVFNETLFYDALIKVESLDASDLDGRRDFIVEHLCSRLDVRVTRKHDGPENFGGRFTSSEADLIKKEFRDRAYSEYTPDMPLSNFLNMFMESVISVKGKLIWGEKTPNHTFCITKILADFPDALVLNVVRNPFDFLISYKYAWRQPGGTSENKRLFHPIITSFLWRRSVEAYTLATLNDSMSQSITVRYEDLKDNPKESLSRICDLLGMNAKEIELEVKGSNSSFSGLREELTKYETAICHAICGNIAKDLDYDVQPKKSLYVYTALIVSALTLPMYFYHAMPILRRRFGGSIFRYLKARGLVN